MIGKAFTMEQILGKSKRLIPNKYYTLFIDKFKEHAANDKYDFVKLHDDKKKILFKVIKKPEFTFGDWLNASADW